MQAILVGEAVHKASWVVKGLAVLLAGLGVTGLAGVTLDTADMIEQIAFVLIVLGAIVGIVMAFIRLVRDVQREPAVKEGQGKQQ